MKSIKDLRTDYQKSELNVEDLTEEPLTLFQQWLSQAITYSNDANAFVLSTVNSNGVPSSRVLLLRDVTKKGFSFFTNYSSRKSQEIEFNPNVCMNFFWPEMERQVRINGSISRLSEQESDDYFISRPYESRIGAWCSPQSQVIESREVLENKIQELKRNILMKCLDQKIGEVIPLCLMKLNFGREELVVCTIDFYTRKKVKNGRLIA